MAHIYILLLLMFVPFVVGIIASIFAHRAPKRGWIGLLLLLLAGAFWSLSEPSGSAAPERLWTLPCFTFFAPVAVFYAFRSRRSAPDRVFATAAFVGSFVIAAALLFLLCGWLYMVYMLVTSPNTSEPTATALAVMAMR